MRRVVSLWLPTWPTDHRRRTAPDAPPPDEPLVTASHDGHRRIIAAADQAARSLGLYSGMPLAHAQAMIPDLTIVEADPDGEAASLAAAATWCLRYAPLTAPDPPDGIWIDATGCPHLFGGEAAMLADLVEKFARAGIAARAAIADTPGAAWAVARHGAAAIATISDTAAALAPLPVAALRLPADMSAALRRLGLERIGQLTARAPLALRFGPILMRRLDQAFGRAPEPITPVLPEQTISQRRAFAEPLCTADAFAAIIGKLVGEICEKLERAGKGARRLDLLFERVDTTTQAVRIGTARPSRAPAHLARLLEERLENVDPGPGVEAMHLIVSLAEPLQPVQTGTDQAPDIAGLVDRLINRLGSDHVYRAAPVESDLAERSVRLVDPLAPADDRSWPDSLPRPTRLFDPPVPVETLAELPDQPPVRFTWRRVQHRIRHADGPERVYGEWWRHSEEVWAVRDYFAVEDDTGARFWLYRNGDMRWFLHGIF